MTVTQTKELPAANDAGAVAEADTPYYKGECPICNDAFRQALRRAYGAWKDNPWTDCVEDIRAMRDEWEHRDPRNQNRIIGHQS